MRATARAARFPPAGAAAAASSSSPPPGPDSAPPGAGPGGGGGGRRPLSSAGARRRIGVGGGSLVAGMASGSEPEARASSIAAALAGGAGSIDSGPGPEDEAGLVASYLAAVGAGAGAGPALAVTGRIGYRTVGAEAGGGEDFVGRYPCDVVVEEAGAAGEEEPEPAAAAAAAAAAASFAVHNLSREYVVSRLSTSPLVQMGRDAGATIDLIYLAHNPEEQGAELARRGAPADEIRGHVRERLTDAFVGLETGAAEDRISSYGVCSNGLGLPAGHPLYLPWIDVLAAASDAAAIVHGEDGSEVASLSTIRLPANPLETAGLRVAGEVRSYLDGPLLPRLPSRLEVHVTRPLTCYPDRGAGTGHPFKMVDYEIDTSDPSGDLAGGLRRAWTHEVKGNRPAHYGPALAATMGHFDATPLLEAAAERDLTVEERETVDGCRLLQSMIHDLDHDLDAIRSFAAYEERLSTTVVPLLHSTFEELDEDSAQVLQAFFVAHGAAVRHAVARTTRKLLRGEGGAAGRGEGVDQKHNVPPGITLQEYALGFLLRHEAVDRVIVGCSKPEHVQEALRAADGLGCGEVD